MTTITDMRYKAQKLSHDAKAILVESDTVKEAERKRDLLEQFDRCIEESDSLYARAQALEDNEARETALEVADPRRPQDTRQIVTSEPTMTENEVFDYYMRYGLNGMTSEARSLLRRAGTFESRASQSIGTNADGGYTVPVLLSDQVTTAMASFGPMLNPACITLQPTSNGDPWNHIFVNDTTNVAVRIAEQTQANTTSVAFSLIPLNAYTYTSGMIPISNELLQDSAIDIAAYVSDRVADRFARGVGAELTTGTGSGQPNGIVHAVGTPALATATANTVAIDDFIELEHSVNIAYRSRPKTAFMLSDSTLKVARKQKASTAGTYLWVPSPVLGEPAAILGYRYWVNPTMAGTSSGSTFTSGNVPILFGDFGAYMVRQTKTMSLVRLVERLADFNQTALIAYARYDGNLLDVNAVNGIKVT